MSENTAAITCLFCAVRVLIPSASSSTLLFGSSSYIVYTMTRILSKLVWTALVCLSMISASHAFPSKALRPSSIQIQQQNHRRSMMVDISEDDQDIQFIFEDNEKVEQVERPNTDDNNKLEDDVPWKKNARWNALSPKVKLRVMREAQDRAIANKKKREPSQDKRRRMMMFVKKKQVQKKRASRVKRSIPFDQRVLLSELSPNTEVSGTVISLTNFGAYVDVGTECDGLLHISQMSREIFVEHPRQIMSPGDTVQVRIKSVNPELKKLHLTMLDGSVTSAVDDDDDDDEERITLEELEVDDELWGEIKRVTDFGGYVELGAKVDGFLHFMDHPEFGANPGAPPSEMMSVGDRIRVWVSDLNMDQMRIKLTANRPQHLPGPRREVY